MKKCRSHLLIDIGYSVHPVANAHLVPHVGRITELVDDTNVIRVGATKQLLLQS